MTGLVWMSMWMDFRSKELERERRRPTGWYDTNRSRVRAVSQESSPHVDDDDVDHMEDE
jgi:hypothetical protein